jgi:hypothetical protein
MNHTSVEYGADRGGSWRSLFVRTTSKHQPFVEERKRFVEVLDEWLASRAGADERGREAVGGSSSLDSQFSCISFSIPHDIRRHCMTDSRPALPF